MIPSATGRQRHDATKSGAVGRPGARGRRIPGILGKLARSGGLARGGLSFFVAMAAVNVSNFAFHVVISRLLGPSKYGALGALLNVLLVVSVPLGAVQASVTQAEAEEQAGGAALNLGRMLRRAMLAGLALALGLVVLTPAFEHFLHLSSPWAVVMLAAWVVPAVAGAVLQGVLMGRLRFGPVALTLVAGSVIGRLAAGVVLVEAGLGVTGAVAASAIGQVVTTVLLMWVVRHELWEHKDARRINVRDGALSVGALAGYWVLASLDTFLARHFLAARAAGWYAAAATAGRIALFIPGAIALLVFPRFAADKGMGAGSRGALRGSLAIVGMLGMAAAFVLWVLHRLVISVLFGPGYGPAGSVVGTLGLEAAGLGLVSLVTYYQLARRSRLALAPWGGAVIAAVGIWLFHQTPERVALVMVVAVGVVLAWSVMGAAHTLLGHPAAQMEPPEHSLWEAVEGEVDLTVVIPFYNPGPALRSHVEAISRELAKAGVDFELIAVSDGSTDDSASTLAGLLPGVVRCVELPVNHGKGEALRVGLAMGRGRYLGFIDADGDLPAELLPAFVELVRREQPDIVTGSKRHPESEVIYPPLRRIYSWGYQGLLWALFQLPVRDTQTGIKLVRREVLAAVLPRMVEKRFAFDLELFVVARRLGYKNIAELPVRIQERFTSTVSLATVRGMLIDTLAILYRLRILRYYDRPIKLVGEAKTPSAARYGA